MNLPDPTPVTDLIDAFRRSKTMFAAVSMGVFDILAEGPADLDTLARRLKAKPASLERLLDACAGLASCTRTASKTSSSRPRASSVAGTTINSGSAARRRFGTIAR